MRSRRARSAPGVTTTTQRGADATASACHDASGGGLLRHDPRVGVRSFRSFRFGRISLRLTGTLSTILWFLTVIGFRPRALGGTRDFFGFLGWPISSVGDSLTPWGKGDQESSLIGAMG